MKKITILLITIAGYFINITAAPIYKIWTQPAVFQADEEVSWFFDVSGTALEGTNEDVYIWTWFPSDKTGINADNKLTKVADNIYKFTITPTDYYGMPADQIVEFYGLLRNASGSKLTDAFAPDQVSAGGQGQIKVPSIVDLMIPADNFNYYPEDYAHDKPVSFLVRASNLWTGCDATPAKGGLSAATELYIVPECNNGAAAIELNNTNKAKLKFSSLGNGIFRFDCVPDELFGKQDPWVYNIKFVVSNADKSIIGKDSACAVFMVGTDTKPVVPQPVLSFFPQKFSQKDLLYVLRTDNEEDVSGLTYTISAEGVTEFSGTFSGNRAKFEAYIDLVTGLAKNPNLKEFRLVIKDNKNKVKTDVVLLLQQ